MRLTFSGLVKALALGGIMVSSVAFGQSSDLRVKQLFLKDADMIAATRAITQQTGLQFIVKPSDRPYGRITLQLNDTSPEDALGYICEAAGAYFVRDEKGVFIISHDKPRPALEPVVAPTGRVARPLRRIRLMHGDARAVYQQIAFAYIADPQEAAISLKRFQKLSSSMSTGREFLPENLQGMASFQPRPSRPGTTIPTTTPTSIGEGGADVVLPGEEGNQIAGGRGGGGGGGGLGGGQGGGIGGGQGGIGGGQGGIGGGQGGQVQLTGGQGLIPESIDYISYDPTDNALIVRGTSEDDINELQNTIATFDIAPKQVTIRVEFITTTEQLERSLGFNVQYNRGTVIAGTDPATFLRLSDPVFLTYATGNAVLRLRARLSEGNAKVVTAPIIRTLNNQPATVTALTQQYIFTTDTIVNGNTTTQGVVAQAIQAGTSLAVAPRINEDGYITLALAPTVGGFAGVQQGPDGIGYPIQFQQSVFCVARVRNRDTIVLGGLNQENISFNTERVPILSDIPIIGQFFKRTLTQKNNSELLIFVTPEIVEDDAGTSGNP